MSFDSIIFDFDGTLVDTSLGIINCMHYAFDKLKKERLDDEVIQQTIGPPLNKMFEILFNSTDEVLISEAVFHFRERYAKEGLIELKLYPDVIELLQNLKVSNKNIFIVTSKPTYYTEMILKNLKIKQFFNDINGVELHQKSLSKSERLTNLINEKRLNKKSIVMIGDRQEDIFAAEANNIFSIGVTYGFGIKEDLQKAGASKILNNIIEINQFLQGNVS